MFESVIERKYLETPNVKLPLVREQQNTLLLLHVNIRSLNKIFLPITLFFNITTPSSRHRVCIRNPTEGRTIMKYHHQYLQFCTN